MVGVVIEGLYQGYSYLVYSSGICSYRYNLTFCDAHLNKPISRDRYFFGRLARCPFIRCQAWLRLGLALRFELELWFRLGFRLSPRRLRLMLELRLRLSVGLRLGLRLN